MNALLLTGFAVAIAVMLCTSLMGRRALWFALAPTLLVYGTMNWDLVAVALATAALLAFVRRRDRAAGVALGLGAATKLYPALLLCRLFAQRLRERASRPARSCSLWSAGGSLARS